MVNYNNGKIYKLVNSIDDQIYIGSSCTRLSDRKSQHKVTSRRHPNRSVYKHLNLVGWENVEIILIENVNCNNKEQLHSRERHYIELLKPSLNKQIPLRSQKEWFQDNPNYLKQYYQANKESINEHKKKSIVVNAVENLLIVIDLSILKVRNIVIMNTKKYLILSTLKNINY